MGYEQQYSFKFKIYFYHILLLNFDFIIKIISLK